jgi:hypothetical protein
MPQVRRKKSVKERTMASGTPLEGDGDRVLKFPSISATMSVRADSGGSNVQSPSVWLFWQTAGESNRSVDRRQDFTAANGNEPVDSRSLNEKRRIPGPDLRLPGA